MGIVRREAEMPRKKPKEMFKPQFTVWEMKNSSAGSSAHRIDIGDENNLS